MIFAVTLGCKLGSGTVNICYIIAKKINLLFHLFGLLVKLGLRPGDKSTSPCKIVYKSDIPCIFSFTRWPTTSSWIVKISIFFVASQVGKVYAHHHANFHQNQSNNWRVIGFRLIVFIRQLTAILDF